ncbi:B3 DNA binding domain [Dillenia turbinata]|uniref:B3 DNA binding domain n=1 Tax=Dillenia turbinata TaxID=194707 RepID=A0AAN8WAJ1_9MAGN
MYPSWQTWIEVSDFWKQSAATGTSQPTRQLPRGDQPAQCVERLSPTSNHVSHNVLRGPPRGQSEPPCPAFQLRVGLSDFLSCLRNFETQFDDGDTKPKMESVASKLQSPQFSLKWKFTFAQSLTTTLREIHSPNRESELLGVLCKAAALEKMKWKLPDIVERQVGFFKVFLPENSSEKLSIPPSFVERMNRLIPETAYLRSSQGRIWHVQVCTIENDKFFQDGWGAFVKDNNFEFGDFILLDYDCNYVFNFQIFGNTGIVKEEAAAYLRSDGKTLSIEEEDEDWKEKMYAYEKNEAQELPIKRCRGRLLSR